ncbi:MAG TPA: sulfurtransferase [Epsilonproteobacteria bacterium]|nr:sulfurtransferase [Campylobacterota bacterium]
MGRIIGFFVLMAFCGSAMLLGSELKLIAAADAIRLVGDKRAIFVSGESNDSYVRHHIIGSINMPAHSLHHSDDMGNMRCAPLYDCPEDAQRYIRSKGIKNDQMIIAYDRFRGSNASGIQSYFESFGHSNVAILNGGLDAIRALDPNQRVFDKLEAEQAAIKKEAKAAQQAGEAKEAKKLEAQVLDIGAKMKLLAENLLIENGEEDQHEPSDLLLDSVQFKTQHIADKAEVKIAVDDILEHSDKSKFAIIDTRSMEEIIGRKKIDHVARGGHIPGAKFIGCENITDAKNKKSFKSTREMQKIFDKVGITRDQTIYLYSHVGAGRASYVAAALRLLGYENVKVFTGSWDTWGNDLSLPIRR